MEKNNPLMTLSTLKNRALPFPEIETSHFLPALKEGMTRARKNIQAIKDNQEPPSFENTVEALEKASDDVDLVASVFFNLLSSHTNDEMQKLAQEIGPKLSEFSSDIILDETLFEKVKKVYDQKDSLKLNQEQSQLLEKSYRDFARNGALLSEEDKKTLRDIDQKLSVLSPQFAENVLKATNAFELVITDKEKLKGLPDSAVEAAAHAAQEKGHKDAWLFTLHAPSYMPFMKYADHRETREQLWTAYNSRCYGDKFDNRDVVQQIVSLRAKRAQLLGFKTHADFVLRERMAESPDKVHSFLDKLIKASRPAAEKDVKQVQEFADSLGGPNPLMPWDFGYYSEKLKQQLFEWNEEELRPYFKLENVIDGAFEHARRLYGLNFKASSDYPVYHKDVKVYEVYDEDNNDFVGLFYADFFPRETKKGGAWMTTFYDQGWFKGEIMRPHASIVCNFTMPTPSKPSLLTFGEVQTLFHEFGHALHGLLSKCQYRSLSGTSVYWDFVELPSQVMENWTLEKEGLDLFAKHFETNDPIPEELTQKIKNSSQFLAGYTSLRQLNFSLLDMAWHDLENPDSISDVGEYETKVTERTNVLPRVPGTFISCAFSHLFSGGYSAGYYSYKWAEVLDADAFEFFKEKGLFNKDVATSFKENILSRGGTEHPMELYKRFRGREPDPDALLRRDGLI